MDKVIDGVDVSECDFLLMRNDNPKCECCHATGFGVICDCEMWKTCYYKQLQRLKEEKDGMQILINGYIELTEKYKQALQDIRKICKNSHTSASEDFYRTADKIQDKINEVIGAEE